VLVAFASALAVGGIAFGYFVALPAAVHFLTNYDTNEFNIQVRARDYYSFVTTVLLAVAIVFEVPVFVLALVRLRVLTAAKLRRHWRLGVVLMAALAVLLPGVDPVTTTFEMIPLVALYLLSIVLAGVFERRWRPEAEPEAEPEAAT
jgi:sec-independent protein translocase protein TatC